MTPREGLLAGRPGRRATLAPGPQADPRARRREQRSWWVYDWANSGWVVLVGSLLLGPLLTSMAEMSACGYSSTLARTCRGQVQVGPLHLATGSVASYTVVLATICAALALPAVGLVVDRVEHKRAVMLGCAWAGASAGLTLGLLPQDAWLPAAALTGVTAVMLACSLVANDSIMVDIAPPSERDAVSSAGWALGYIGGLVVLVASLAWLSGTDAQSGGTPSLEQIGHVVAFGAAWWGLWTIVPFLGIRDRQLDPAVRSLPRGPRAPLVALGHTWRELRRHPQAVRFLVAFLFYNDGMQSLFASASVYATRELGFGAQHMIAALLVVQVVAFVGAVACGRLASRIGAKAVILATLVVWTCAPVAAAVLPRGNFAALLALLGATGFVMGGTQSLSRSLFSQLVPSARAAEFFGLYQATDRGTSWFGALAFGLIYQFSGDYRLAVAGLVAFFLLGAPLLAGVDVRAGMAQANPAPADAEACEAPGRP